MAISDWNEKQVLGLTAGIVGAILLIMAGLVFYIYKEHTKLGAEIAKLKRENKTLQVKADTLEEKTEELENLRKIHAPDRLRLPDEDEVGSLRDQVTEQTRNAKLKVISFNPAKKARGRRRGAKPARGGAQKSVALGMAMELRGSFHDLGRFLNRLEGRLERIVAVKGFVLTANKDGMVPDNSELQMSLQFEAYRHKVPKRK